MPTTLRRTPLHEAHVAAGARMVEFAGWEMPLQYEGVLGEHMAVRETCGIFDVSHMGQIETAGAGALSLLQRLLSNDVAAIDFSLGADGTTAGYDLEVTAAVADAVSIPVIASGGCGSADHIHEVLTRGRADAALAASIFHYGTTTVKAVKDLLRLKGVPVR